MSVDYVQAEDALEAVKQLGLVARDVGLLVSALERPRTDVFGVEAYPDIHQKAAALIDGNNRAHALLDGNKRLSWVLTVLFYERNGLDLYATVDEGAQFVLVVAASHQEVEEIAGWLRAHVQPL
ncbi:MAG: type II toxin-antitoxin system death-on-curing family toxin [Jiangellaceae bacterium]